MGTSLPVMHIPLPRILFFLWMSSIPALQVLTVLQVPIQATRNKENTLPKAYLLFVLFRVLDQYFFLWMSSIPAHQVLTVLQVPIQATQHKGDTLPKEYLLPVLFRVLHHYFFL